jgi:carbamoyl-phosphate synthase large subunit
VESIEQILAENNIDAVLPTMGGQTALNLCKEVDELGIWEKYNVQDDWRRCSCYQYCRRQRII